MMTPKEGLEAIAIIRVALDVTPAQKLAIMRSILAIGKLFVNEGFGTGLMISTLMRFIVSIAAEQRWTEEQLLAILRDIYISARPGADAAYSDARQKLG